jgi:hypothetical protein
LFLRGIRFDIFNVKKLILSLKLFGFLVALRKLFLSSVSVVLPLLVFTFCGFYGATLGFGGGDDASSVYGIVDTITSWHYRPSRV